MTILLEANLNLFFGRFHSLVVHLPIGFIILTIILELISWKKKVDMDFAIIYGLMIGVIFGIIAITLGFLLESDGGYNEDILNTHKWTGILTTLVTLIAYLIKRDIISYKRAQKVYPLVLVLTLVLLSVAGIPEAT